MVSAAQQRQGRCLEGPKAVPLYCATAIQATCADQIAGANMNVQSMELRGSGSCKMPALLTVSAVLLGQQCSAARPKTPRHVTTGAHAAVRWQHALSSECDPSCSIRHLHVGRRHLHEGRKLPVSIEFHD